MPANAAGVPSLAILLIGVLGIVAFIAVALFLLLAVRLFNPPVGDNAKNRH